MSQPIESRRGEGNGVVIAIVALVAIAAVVFVAFYVMNMQPPQEQPNDQSIKIEIPTTNNEPTTEPAPTPEPTPTP